MATASNRQPREVVEFPPNIPVTVALKYSQGRTVSGQSGERFMFTLADDRVMFLDPEVAGQIMDLGVNVRENFSITKQQAGTRAPITWAVARVCGEQPNGTFVTPALPSPATGANGAVTPPAKPMAAATAAQPDDSRRQPSTALVADACGMVDAFAEVLEHALTRHSGKVKPDEVRAIFLTVAINRSKFAA